MTTKRKSGPSNDLGASITRNAQKLWRYFLVRVGGDEAMADELMQDLCLQAARANLPDGDADLIDRWFFGVARNVLRNHWRTITRRRRNLPQVRGDLAAELADVMDSTLLPEEQLHNREVQEQLMLAITALTREDQDLIFMHYFEGLSQRDIAAATGASPRSVEGRLYRARKALKKKLEHLED